MEHLSTPVPGLGRTLTETFIKIAFPEGEFADLPGQIEDILADKSEPKVVADKLEAIVSEKQLLIGPIADYLFDLLMMRLIFEGGRKEDEDYFSSDEWVALEEQTADRGSELINFMIYLADCLESGTKPTLDDFLNEFLLVDEDDDTQDDFFIYEELIANQDVVDAPLVQIFEIADQVDSGELAEIFAPIVLFFRNYKKTADEIFPLIADKSSNPALDSALLQLLLAFWRGGA